MRMTVGVAEMCVATHLDDVVITHALGSCLGITAYDPAMVVGGMLHVMLPLSRIDPEKARTNPCMFVDTGVPWFLDHLYRAGARPDRLRIAVAGGASIGRPVVGALAIGARNWSVLKRLLWKNGLLITGEDVGGTAPRTMTLVMRDGTVTLATAGRVRQLEEKRHVVEPAHR